MTLKETLKYMEAQIPLKEAGNYVKDPTQHLGVIDLSSNQEVQAPQEFIQSIENALNNGAKLDEINNIISSLRIPAKLGFLKNTPENQQVQKPLLNDNTNKALVDFANQLNVSAEKSASLNAKQSQGTQLTPQETQELKNAEEFVPKSELDYLKRSRGYYKGQLTKANNQISNLQNELQNVQQELAKLKEIPASPEVSDFSKLSDEDLEKQIADQSKKAKEYLDRISYLTDLANRLLNDPKLTEASNINKKLGQGFGGFLKGLLNTAAGIVGNFIGGIANGMGAAK